MSYLQYSTMHKNNYESNIEKLASFEYKKTQSLIYPLYNMEQLLQCACRAFSLSWVRTPKKITVTI
jgi:hypothetical protein